MLAPDFIPLQCPDCARQRRERIKLLKENPIVSCECGAEFDVGELIAAVSRSMKAGERHEQALHRLRMARRPRPEE